MKGLMVYVAAFLLFAICTGTALVGLSFLPKKTDNHVTTEKITTSSGAVEANFPVVVIADAKAKMTDGSPAIGIQAVIIVGKEAETQKKIDIEEAFNIWKTSNPSYKIIRKEKSWDNMDKIHTMYVEFVQN
ncbi:MAG: hypothetical protein WAV11_00040 [Minisyncoccia bacterium]